MKIKNKQFGEQGYVLVTGLLFLLILTILGTTAYMSTSNELAISKNYELSKAALFAAEAGIQEARERLRLGIGDPDYIGDPDPNRNIWWSSYLMTSASWNPADEDSQYDSNFQNYVPTGDPYTQTAQVANSLQTDIEYYVRIRYKREYEAEAAGHTTTTQHYYDGDGDTTTNSSTDPGEILHYGYGNPFAPYNVFQHTSTSPSLKPVMIVTSYGYANGTQRVIEVEIARPPGPPIPGPLYGKSDITLGGTSDIDGRDECKQPDSSNDKPPVMTLSPATTTVNGGPELLGSPPAPQSGDLNVDIDKWVESLKSSADMVLTSDENGGTYGSDSNYLIIYCYAEALTQGLRLNGVSGYGTLLVEGDLDLAGSLEWYGLILCTGTITFQGGGKTGINIHGAALGESSVTVGGGVDVNYNSCEVEKAFGLLPYAILSWRQIY
ncbi:PilX N-terminal domain-containing pilus assembly protein [Desulfobacterales bacterium HSG16]|nr:PilX N-terminal domain-containing pilus assembly protein [Desulfobacterales bacterium HSG16]